MIYVVAGKIDNKNILLLGKDNSLTGSENLEEAKKLLPNFNGYHKAGTTWSTSASIYWMTFQPRLIQFTDMQEIESALLDRKIHGITNISGSVIATYLKEEYPVNVVMECPLIDERVNEAKPFYEK
jgi:hypothetical protein